MNIIPKPDTAHAHQTDPWPPKFGDDESKERWEESCRAQKLRQTSKYAIAPGCAVPSARGGMLQAGDEITVADVGGNHARLRQLTARSVILELTDAELRRNLTPDDAEFVAARAFTTGRGGLRGIAEPGEGLDPNDFPGGRQRLLELAQKGLVVHNAPNKAGK